MITNETRAKLIGWERRMVPVMHGGFAEADGPVYPEPYWFAQDGSRKKFPPQFDTDANAVAELRAFVRARGEMRKFVDALINELHDEWRREDRDNRTGFTETRFDLIDATPAQQCAAFDAVFAGELSRIE